MKWQGRRQSGNVEDRRGFSGGKKVLAGGGAIALIFFILQMFMGGDNAQLLQQVEQQLNQTTQPAGQADRELTEEEMAMGNFAATVLAGTEDAWDKIFQENNIQYREPGMVLFYDEVQTACGGASSASGPFYCPADQKVYMDLRFFEELYNRFGAKRGDFAIAYVIAHEVGHHVQTLLGTSVKVRQLQSGMSQTQANKLSIAQELQADFYAGLWARYIQNYLDEGDIDEALSAAQAVGDDAIQKRVTGRVVPDTFTHGTSAQRKEWFLKGYQSGDIRQGDTFKALLE